MHRQRPGSGTHHEQVALSQAAVELSSDRTFGIVFAVFFAILWVVPALRGRGFRSWALAVSLVFLALAFTVPKLLHPLNRMWAMLAIVLHHIVSPLAMGLIFFAAFTPMGWLLRAMGKDLLRLQPRPDADSYWIRREIPGPPPEGMAQQF